MGDATMDIKLVLDGVAWTAECESLSLKASGKAAHNAVYALAQLIEARAEGTPTDGDALAEIRTMLEANDTRRHDVPDKLREILERHGAQGS
jgi:hypothetical protein